jgi:hypothetical protein
MSRVDLMLLKKSNIGWDFPLKNIGWDYFYVQRLDGSQLTQPYFFFLRINIGCVLLTTKQV